MAATLTHAPNSLQVRRINVSADCRTEAAYRYVTTVRNSKSGAPFERNRTQLQSAREYLVKLPNRPASTR